MTVKTALDRIIVDLLNTGQANLEAAGVPVSSVFFVPGVRPAWDNCCGTLYVRLIRQFPTGGPDVRFPTPKQHAQACGVNELAVNLGLGVLRCAHTIDDRGMAPTDSEMSSDAFATLVDSEVLLNTFIDTLTDNPCVLQHVVGMWTPVGPQGGCVGGEWDVTIGISVYPVPEPTPAVEEVVVDTVSIDDPGEDVIVVGTPNG